jgi:GNAT superfamily N-acetyltransferase
MARNSIRAATKADENFIKQIYKESKQHLGSFDLFMCWQKYLSGESKERFDVIDGKGFVRWGYSKKYGGYLLKDIGVLQEHRGKGIGQQLLKHVPTPVMLKCNADNKTGNKFYEGMGMIKAGRTATKKGVEQIIWTCAGW